MTPSKAKGLFFAEARALNLVLRTASLAERLEAKSPLPFPVQQKASSPKISNNKWLSPQTAQSIILKHFMPLCTLSVSTKERVPHSSAEGHEGLWRPWNPRSGAGFLEVCVEGSRCSWGAGCGVLLGLWGTLSLRNAKEALGSRWAASFCGIVRNLFELCKGAANKTFKYVLPHIAEALKTGTEAQKFPVERSKHP